MSLGRYTRGFLLPEHAPVSFCMCQYTRGSVFKFTQFAPRACSQIFNRLNIVEHFAGWKFCSRGRSIPMKSLVHTEELCSQSVPLEHAPGAKSLMCIDLRFAQYYFQNNGRRFQKVHFRLTCMAWKRRCLNSLIFFDGRGGQKNDYACFHDLWSATSFVLFIYDFFLFQVFRVVLSFPHVSYITALNMCSSFKTLHEIINR